jgi:hypothetical protein
MKILLITNNFGIISTYYNLGDYCKIVTWTFKNLLVCIDASGNTKTYNPLTSIYTSGIQITQIPISSILQYPFAVNSYDMFLTAYSTYIYGFNLQANIVYSNTTAIAFS